MDSWFQAVVDSVNIYTDHVSSENELYALTYSWFYSPGPHPKGILALLEMAVESSVATRLAALGSLLALCIFHESDKKWEPPIPESSLPLAIYELRSYHDV